MVTLSDREKGDCTLEFSIGGVHLGARNYGYAAEI